MSQSMTGFASKQFYFGEVLVQLEIKSVNHRFCEMQINLPFLSMEVENAIKKIISKKVHRGKVYFSLRGDFSLLGGGIDFNPSVVDAYLSTMGTLGEVIGTKDKPSVIELLQLPGVMIEKQDQSWHSDLLVSCVEPLDGLLNDFIESRVQEGLFLENEISDYLEKMQSQLNFIDQSRNEIKAEQYSKLDLKIKEFLKTSDLDQARLHTEVAYLLEKADIEEEIVRLNSHITACSGLLKKDEESGKKLNFICQEMNREINTIGSKSQKIDIVTSVIEMKSLLEKIREQIQNIQ
ncbi:MAG: YicC family protein [Candidatus Cloacimonetes bacterium]|nr:YicC family protein [Candidatus Cloacimonadota bacterium]